MTTRCGRGCWAFTEEMIAQAESSGVKLANHAIWRCLPLDLRAQALADGVTPADYRQYRPEGWAGPYLVRTADHIRRIVDSVPSDSNGLAMCTGMYITGAEPLEEVARFAGRINYVQIRDLDARWPAAREVFSRYGKPGLPGYSARPDRRRILRIPSPRAPRPAPLRRRRSRKGRYPPGEGMGRRGRSRLLTGLPRSLPGKAANEFHHRPVGQLGCDLARSIVSG